MKSSRVVTGARAHCRKPRFNSCLARDHRVIPVFVHGPSREQSRIKNPPLKNMNNEPEHRESATYLRAIETVLNLGMSALCARETAAACASREEMVGTWQKSNK